RVGRRRRPSGRTSLPGVAVDLLRRRSEGKGPRFQPWGTNPGGRDMRVSVILSTYNQPAWLELVLWGYSVQTHRDFEIVIADDGSTQATAEMLERMRVATGLDIKHVWHEDEGFRKCRILNLALVQATGDYTIFSDGD